TTGCQPVVVDSRNSRRQADSPSWWIVPVDSRNSSRQADSLSYFSLMYSFLKGQPEIDAAQRSALRRDYARFQNGLPDSLESYVKEQYQIDLGSEYGNHPIKNPFGKGSGQLSLNTSQVRRDCEDGLGFVVLKSIIAEDASGAQSMSEWAIEE